MSPSKPTQPAKAAPGAKSGLPELSPEEMRLLLHLGERLVAELDLHTVLALVAETACQVVQAETLAVPMVDPDRRTFTYRAASGDHAALVLGHTFPIHEGNCGWVIRTRRPLLFGEGGDFAMDTSQRWQPGMASSVLVPLVCRGAIIGGLSAMGKRGGGAFDLRDLAVLALFANQASIAIDNARLFQTLSANESRLRLVLDSAGEAIYGVDRDGMCTFANPSCLRMLGYATEAELIGRHTHTTFHHSHADGGPAPYSACLVHRAVLDCRPTHTDAEVYWRRDGTSFPVECWAHPMEQDGRVVGAVVTFIDITERKAMKDELIRSNAELEQFAYVASHDLQTPLRNIVSYTQLLERRYKNRFDSDADEFIGFIVDSSKQMTRLINDLLEYSRVSSQSKPLRPVAAGEAVLQAIDNLRGEIDQAGAAIAVGDLPPVMAERSHLVRLFQNLLGNGLKYRAPDRKPRLSVTADRVAPDRWLFAVADNGIGIEPQYFDKIFDIFQRLNPASEREGTGIGLTVCRRIVHRFGGAIWVNSVPGEGTTFLFTLRDGGG